MKIYLIRHGVTVWNESMKWQGKTDIPLNDEGIRQAKLVASRFKGKDIKTIYSSPLVRAKATADSIAGELALPVETENDLAEISLGPWESLTINEIENQYTDLWARWEKNYSDKVHPEIETYKELQERAYSAVERIVRKEESGNIVLVSHGAWIRALVLEILKIDPNNRMSFEIDNTSITVLRWGERGFRLVSLNDTAHLEEC